jgi:hypothetical protein
MTVGELGRGRPCARGCWPVHATAGSGLRWSGTTTCFNLEPSWFHARCAASSNAPNTIPANPDGTYSVGELR